MARPEYLHNYMFDWEVFDVVVGGRSALDSRYFIEPLNNENQVESFIQGYGVDPNDPISQAELFGNFQEAMQFIKRYFLKEGNPEGIDLTIPNSLYMITSAKDLFLMATGNMEGKSTEERLWAEIVLKVMHTILHVDKDIRSNYFSVIQTQIFDRYYKNIFRDKNDKLFLGRKGKIEIPLVDFETKSKKSRDSVIIKLLHKAENVAEELFDRVGVRVITESRFDTLRAIKFLLQANVIIPHNIKPSRSINTIFDIDKFKESHHKLVKKSIREDLSEENFLNEVERLAFDAIPFDEESDRNRHSRNSYQSIQFTCRQLIKYKNPFFAEFSELRKVAREKGEDDEMAKKILDLDYSKISRGVKFFYPYEVQIVDEQGHKINTEGEASHSEYKRSQLNSAMKRVFWALLKHKGIEI